ncbi:MAG: redoxin domain-containing protein [Bacteroidetes bacterium]|nr:redoxin domain-containing protein [Bacteroidota bacterium]
MKKFLPFFLILSSFVLSLRAQNAHDIKINFKGNKDTCMYLVKYTWDQQYIVDTCKKIKNGLVEFKGKRNLDKGVYTLVSQGKAIYFDFFVNESQKFSIQTDFSDVVNSLKSPENKENENFFAYIKFITNKNQEFGKIREQAKGKSKADSIKFVTEKFKVLNEEVKKFDSDFMQKVKGTFVYDVLNLKTEKEAVNVPKASNGRPDSVYQYYYYKGHYFDGIDFKDDRIIRTPFFDDRLKKYFETVIVQHPDTVINEIDKLISRCAKDSLIYNTLVVYFTFKYEQSKIMGFDKVFVHMADKYIISGASKKLGYTEETISKIKERVDILRNLLLDAKVSELYMIDTTYGKQVMKMGFDTCKTSKSVTNLYYKNLEKLTPMFRTLYQVNAKYTVLVFWASDCGHCQTEIPKLQDNLKELKGKIDYKVFSVQTKDDFEAWRKFIIEKKLDFINVFDPVHLNNLKERFDIYSTPVIYILDKDKKIKAKRLSADQVIDMLKMLDAIDKKNNK